jgi:hypothetical protein
MARARLGRPQVSRETRLLLGIVLMSLVALWLLARLRFPARDSRPNPVQPLLTQFTPRSSFEDLALSVSQLAAYLAPSIVAIPLAAPGVDGRAMLPGLRLRDDVAVTLVPAGAGHSGIRTGADVTLRASDTSSGLAVVSLPGSAPSATAPELWTPRRMDDARYLMAGDISGAGPSFRPVFVGSLHEAESPAWAGPIWVLPPGAQLTAGTIVFSTEGAWAGLVTTHDGQLAIAPGALVSQTAERLLSEAPVARGQLGVSVQAIGSALASATGASHGVIVTWVDRDGPATGRLAITDVIESVDGEKILSTEHWHARVSRLPVGTTVTLRVRRGADAKDVAVSTAAVTRPAAGLPLGLTMRAIRRTGVEVLQVQPASAAARAGIEVGDILTVIAGVTAPTPAQVAEAFAAAPADRPVVVAVTRGDRHHVLTIHK